MMKKLFYVAALVMVGVFAIGTTGAMAVESTFHGEFRINSYYQSASDDTVFNDNEDIQAARLRWRPTWDLKFDNGVAMHMQLNIGDVNSNIMVARTDVSGNAVVGLRHAYLLAPIPDAEGWALVGGIFPLADEFNQTLFSAEWDFNPMVFAVVGKVSDVNVRLGHANLSENNEGGHPADDLDAWVFDLDRALGNGTVGASFYQVNANNLKIHQHYIGVRVAQTFGTIDFNGFAIYNFGKRKELTGTVTEHKNTGWAVRGEVKVPVGPAKVGLLAIYATGDKDYSLASPTKDKSNAFITPASLVGGTGYWGYTGKLSVLPVTDTGITRQAINIDGADYQSAGNLGRGLTTLQLNASFNILPDKLDGYAAVGYFKSNDAPSGSKKDIGTDLIAMGTYHFGGNLNLDFGVDYVAMGKGHPDSTALTTEESRNMTLLFSRLQMEF